MPSQKCCRTECLNLILFELLDDFRKKYLRYLGKYFWTEISGLTDHCATATCVQVGGMGWNVLTLEPLKA